MYEVLRGTFSACEESPDGFAILPRIYRVAPGVSLSFAASVEKLAVIADRLDIRGGGNAAVRGVYFGSWNSLSCALRYSSRQANCFNYIVKLQCYGRPEYPVGGGTI